MSQVYAFVESLDTERRDLVNAMLRVGDEALKKNGMLNVAALAEFMGKPYRQVWRSVSSMRAEFGQALIAGVA